MFSGQRPRLKPQFIMRSYLPSRRHPDYLLRATWHDYRSRCIYLVTFNKKKWVESFSKVVGRDVELTEAGAIVERVIFNLPERFPQVSVIRHCVMPDHVHLVVFVREPMEHPLGYVIGKLKAACSRLYWDVFGVEREGIFEEGFNDKIVRKQGQLERFIGYVEDNPLRLYVRRGRPEYFSRCRCVMLDGEEHSVYGNFMLLRSPVMSAVRVSSKFSPEELADRQREWEETIRCGGTLVSPFISNAEKEVRDRGVAAGASLIRIVNNGLPERYKPSGEEFNLCAEGRLLIIAPAAHRSRSETVRRDECLAMNALAEKIAAGAPELVLRNAGRDAGDGSVAP